MVVICGDLFVMIGNVSWQSFVVLRRCVSILYTFQWLTIMQDNKNEHFILHIKEQKLTPKITNDDNFARKLQEIHQLLSNSCVCLSGCYYNAVQIYMVFILDINLLNGF